MGTLLEDTPGWVRCVVQVAGAGAGAGGQVLLCKHMSPAHTEDCIPPLLDYCQQPPATHAPHRTPPHHTHPHHSPPPRPRRPFFGRLLHPMQHYVPFYRRLPQEALEAVTWAQQHDEQAAAIARRTLWIRGAVLTA